MSDTNPGGGGARVARQPSGGSAHNVVVLWTVELWFQKSPGAPGSEHREITNLSYRLRREGAIIQAVRTVANGRIVFRAPSGVTTVDLMFNNRPVASYEVTLSDAPLPAVTTVTGLQRRLRMLGYHLGHAGPRGNGVDGSLGSRSERSILDYQVDKGFAIVGDSNTETQNGLTGDVVTS